MKELIEIQSRLNVPKNQYNSFGKYKYRSCEDILEAIKPLLREQGCILTLSDDIKEVGTSYKVSQQDMKKGSSSTFEGTRVYVVATATIINSNGDKVSVTASAREEAVKAGMDAAQITGSASSYARKYALNGLFCIDDNKDPDVPMPPIHEPQPQPKADAFMPSDPEALLTQALVELDMCDSREEFNMIQKKYLQGSNPILSGNDTFISKCKEVAKKYPKS